LSAVGPEANSGGAFLQAYKACKEEGWRRAIYSLNVVASWSMDEAMKDYTVYHKWILEQLVKKLLNIPEAKWEVTMRDLLSGIRVMLQRHIAQMELDFRVALVGMPDNMKDLVPIYCHLHCDK
jgi:hypothetical protein